MKNNRRIHSAEFKARIALEALKGLKTVQQIAAENEVHPTHRLAIPADAPGQNICPRS
jgi:transposase-like protein